MKYSKIFSTFIFIPFLIMGCSKTVSEPASDTLEGKRFAFIKKLDNYSWKYYTEIANTDSSKENLVKTVYIGEGHVTKTGASTEDTYYQEFVYPLEEFRNAAQKEGVDVKTYIENSYITGNDFYAIDENAQTVTINTYRKYVLKCFVHINGNTKQYSSYRVFSDDVDLFYESTLESSELTYLDYISANYPLYQELLQEKNRIDTNSYRVGKPNSPFYFADSGMILTEHQVDGVRVFFSGEVISGIGYVRDGRDISVSFFDINSTILEDEPIVND